MPFISASLKCCSRPIARDRGRPGRHDLDDVDALGGELANRRLALLDAGTDGRAQMRVIHGLRELGRKPVAASACPPMIERGSPETRMRGPGKRPSATASRTAVTALASPPRSRTVVNPPRAISSACVRPRVVA